MPALSFKFIFNMIPEKAPILLKPFLKGIFDALINRMTLPRLRIHVDFVGTKPSPAHRSNSRYVTDRSAPEQVKISMVRRGL